MTLDLYLAGALLAFGLLGAWSGAIKQFSQWIGLAASYLLAKPLGMALGPLAAKQVSLPPSLGPLLAGGLLFPAIFFSVSLLAHFLLKRAMPERVKTKGDRLAGLGMGAAKAGAMAYVLLSVVLAFEEPLDQAGWDLSKRTDGSRAVSFVRGHNLFSRLHIPALENVRKLASAHGDPQAAMALLATPQIKELLADPKIKAAMDDPRLKSLLQDPELAKKLGELAGGRGNPAELMSDPRIQQLLQDPELAKKMGEFQQQAQQAQKTVSEP